jgi:hypothetical protein
MHGFVLPLVAGGDVRVRGAFDARALERLEALCESAIEGDPAAIQVAEARREVAAELWLDAPAPLFDEDSARLAVAVQNLLFLAHPGAQSLPVTAAARRKVAHFAVETATLEAPSGLPDLVARHSLVHHLFDLGRDDVRVSFWAGRREYRGAEPPGRLLKWPQLRRVREERWRVGVVAESIADPLQREIVTALLTASPLTDLLDPTRLEPRFDLKPLTPWLRDPRVARAVADRHLSMGLDQVGPAWVAALLDLYGAKSAQAEARLATRFFCHLQLLWLLGEANASEATRRTRVLTLAAQKEVMKDVFGLFAAADRLGLAKPGDLEKTPRLEALVESHVQHGAAVCGASRVLELLGAAARGVGELALAS